MKTDKEVQREISAFEKVVLPMVRRVIPGTIATELVGVPPMTYKSFVHVALIPGKKKRRKK